MNHIILIGHLANDPELTYTDRGVSRCTFRLATQRNYVNQQTGKKDADFHNIVTWRQLAESCNKWLNKGRKCAVTGSVQYRRYLDTDGVHRYATEIVAESVEFLDWGNQSGGRACVHPTGGQVGPCPWKRMSCRFEE